MINLKCKVCGGELVMQGDRIAACKECGNLMLLPVIDSDVRDDMFNRGNYYRMHYEFDRAAQAFEQIIARDPEDVEARFCLALCHYGVEYVRDPRSGEYKPTCHRGNTYSILEDVDYQAALKYAPPQVQETLKKQANEIHRIWQQIMDIARYEEPYDVFICYKESLGMGINPDERTNRNERTRDSVLAQELYEELTGRGLRVFFSRISLENKLGSAYEPHIFAALQSARVMLVVATRRDHVEAVWVKNEWQRFMHLRRQDRSREIIPVLSGMDEYDLPDEFADCIPRNIDETGVRQDLIRGVLKITGHTEGSIGMIRNRELEALAAELLVQGNWEDAEKAADQMLNLNAENGEAYKIRFLAEIQADSLESCKELRETFENMQSFGRLKKYARGNLRREIDELLIYREKRSAYLEALSLMEQEQFEAAYAALVRAGDYRDALTLIGECKRKAKEQKAARELQENIERYQSEVKNARAQVDSEWAKQYPDVAARGEKLRKSLKELARPSQVGTISSIIYFILIVLFCASREDNFIDQLEVDLMIGIPALVYMMVVVFKLLKIILPKVNENLRFWIAILLGFAAGGLLYGFGHDLLETSLVETWGKIMAKRLSWAAVLAVNMVLFLLLFFREASAFVKNENKRQKETYFREVEVPALKKQLMNRKLEELRGKYEPLIGADNCKKYAG